MLDIHDLMNATYAEDEPAMAKIMNKMTLQEVHDFRRHLIILATISDIVLREKIYARL